MAKNIVIFSDGTGQAGGLRPDQNLSNIYKLFRACRTGIESPIDPALQIAVYDAGLGTENDEGKIPFRPIQKFRKLWSGATGTGLSRNITDCYEAILKHYEPGDRIYLFGFSRGAYTARCVGGVLALCGVPTRGDEKGGPVPRLGSALRQIANEAVQRVYEHGSGSDNPERKQERLEAASRFREKFGSNDAQGKANVVPYFIGVFDTVAALGALGPRRVFMRLILFAFIAGMVALAAGALSLLPWFSFCANFAGLGAIVLISYGISWFRSHVKWIRNFPTKGKLRWHVTSWQFRFYDLSLNPRVRYARHALAIDETRADFMRVPWANEGQRPDRQGEPEWLKQIWFAGNHSDIGGSYAEDESRLSDISLQWMLDEATTLPFPLIVDPTRLNLFPDPQGMQHSEIESMRDAYPAWWPRESRWTWKQEIREIPTDAPLHATVEKRFRVSPGILDYGKRAAYRPKNLCSHSKVATFYAAVPADPTYEQGQSRV
ncbi:DUF2235 domain-containing protein [Comamonadaceae bacterium PP-2]